MEDITSISSLFKLALEGRITRNEFHDKWKALAQDDEFYRTLGTDLDDAITHTPFHIFSKKVDFPLWRGFLEYQIIFCDSLLLPHYAGDKRAWLAMRDKLIAFLDRMGKFDEASIRREIERIIR